MEYVIPATAQEGRSGRRMSCKCQECDNDYKMDVLVPQKIWEQIKPNGKVDDAGLLCGSCICGKMEALLGYSAFELREVKESRIRHLGEQSPDGREKVIFDMNGCNYIGLLSKTETHIYIPELKKTFVLEVDTDG